MSLQRWAGGKSRNIGYSKVLAPLVAQLVESACNSDDLVQSLGWKIPKGRQPTPVFLSGEFHGQKSLPGFSPWGCRELDTTE